MSPNLIAIISLIITVITLVISLIGAIFPRLFPAIGEFLLSLKPYIWIIVVLVLVIAAQQIYISM